jgi:hypothetical protein
MNVNGKVDYLLFKRNIEDEQYQLLQEQKLYELVVKYFPFSDRIYAIEKPRRRGIAVNGEAAAKELNDINKEVIKAIEKLKSADSIEIKQANIASDAVTGLKGALKIIITFTMVTDHCLHGGYLKLTWPQIVYSIYIQWH